jgi:hypothetical protein
MLAFQATFYGSSKSKVPYQVGKQIQDGRSFVGVLRSNSRVAAEVAGLKLLLSQLLDLFPMSIRFEKGNDGVEQRLAADCYEMESSTPSFLHCLQNPRGGWCKVGKEEEEGYFWQSMGEEAFGVHSF